MFLTFYPAKVGNSRSFIMPFAVIMNNGTLEQCIQRTRPKGMGMNKEEQT